MEQRAEAVHRSGALHLLIALFLLILASPLFEGGEAGRIVTNALYSLVLLAIARAASDGRRIQVTFLALAVLAILLLWLDTGDQATASEIAGLLLFAALNAAAIALVLRRMLLAPAVNFDVICGAVAIYLLLGVTWALTYMVLDAVDPAAFELLSLTAAAGWTDFLYFSFATLTTLGYGDISPTGDFVRIWAVMEAAVGVLYLAVLVARLVSLYRS